MIVPRRHQRDESYAYLGAGAREMTEFAHSALLRRMKLIGVGVPAVTSSERVAQRSHFQ